MHNLNLTDETFDVNQSNNYFLLMQSSLNGFSYVICDTVRNKCILLKHFENKCNNWEEYKLFLETIIDKESDLNLTFKEIHHIVSSPQFTIVPEEFVPEKHEDFEKFFPGLSNMDSVITGSSNNIIKAAVICPYPVRLLGLLQKRFKCVRLSHNSLPFTVNLVNESTKSLRYIFHLLVQDNSILIGVAHSGKLDFINIFAVNTFEDILYYLLSVLDKFKVLPAQAEINIVNETGSSDLNERLEAHVSKVRPLKASQNIVYSYVITEEVLERFANLLNLYHCE